MQKLNQNNEDNYDDLLVSIEANQNQLNLLIVLCDHLQLREQILNRYETELKSSLPCYRIELSLEQPSLSFQLADLVAKHEDLKQCPNAVITVTGTEQFRFVSSAPDAHQSPQEELLGYLQ